MDIDYDDGEKEIGVDRDNVRLSGFVDDDRNSRDRYPSSSSASRYDSVNESKGHSSGRLDGEYDDAYETRGSRVRADESKYGGGEAKGADVDDDIRTSRLKSLGKSNDTDEIDFKKGDKVACYWYKNQKYAVAKAQSRPKAAVVLRFNSDNTYTVEMELDGNIIDDVPVDKLKVWGEATEDLRPGAGGKIIPMPDKWVAVTVMAQKFKEQGKTDKDHRVPALDELTREVEGTLARRRRPSLERTSFGTSMMPSAM